MRLLKILRLRLRSFFRPDAVEQELDDELRFHLERQVEEYLARGVPPAEARRRARRDVGALDRWKDDCRDTRRVPRLEDLARDLRLAVRAWQRQPGLAVLAVVILSIGIGANVAMFDLVDTLMFRPPPHVRAPERLVMLPEVENYVQFATVLEHARTLDAVAYTNRELSLDLGDEASAAQVECVSSGFFDVLGTRLALGRGFRRDAIDEPAVVLSHGLWQRRFGGAEDVLGRSVSLDARAFNVTGVAPRGFKGLGTEPVDAWILVTAAPERCSFADVNLLSSSRGSWLDTFGRLRPDATIEAASSDLEALLSAEERFDREVSASPGPLVRSFSQSRRERLSSQNRLALWLAGGAIAVLLIACANVGGLLSIRAIDRRREIAVRFQLGAGRAHILRQFMIEQVVLSVACGVAAMGVAVWVNAVLAGFFPYGIDGADFAPRVFFVAAGVALAAGMASGVPPAVQLLRADATVLARSSGPAALKRSWFRSGLLVAQVALALVLLIGAGLFVRSVVNRERSLGFDADRLVVAVVDVARAGYRAEGSALEVFERIADRLRRHPDIESVALSSGSLLGAGGFGSVFLLRASLDDRSRLPGRPMQFVSPEYFRTLGTPVASGRAFSAADTQASERVIIVDRVVAAEMWPGRDPVGECAYMSVDCVRVVGVTEPRRTHANTPGGGEVFRPIGQAGAHFRPQMLVIRPRGDVSAAVGPIAGVIRGAVDDLPFVTVRPLEDVADEQNRSWRLGRTMFGGFGLVAVLLASIGLYGVLAFHARQRTAEIGVRMALGATPHDILRLVVRHGLRLVCVGWLLGAAAAFSVAERLQSLLFEVSATDVGTFAVASTVIVAAGSAGCVLPALRAARVDPVVALRRD